MEFFSFQRRFGLLRKMLHMQLAGAPEIDDAPSGEGHEVTRAARGSDLPVEGGIGIFCRARLRPGDQGGDGGRIELFGHRAVLWRGGEHEGFAAGQVVRPGMAPVIDEIAFKARFHQDADGLWKAERIGIGASDTFFGNSDLLRVHGAVPFKG
ncbi:hypothetical protein HNE_3123 [Hyphomonas neptunium ATCC 15444]|uniref:Uncharacterized protein n=1 Tax=Hyphomonas neptunium (strain ATCC 15444) TaxID=228405 RepID=Q0BXJ5_HYPNA|nr:hypothetical protein HNE_3123 [Hyphomonas neptunium ATCC 15444]